MSMILESLQAALTLTAWTVYQLAKPTVVILALAWAISLVV